MIGSPFLLVTVVMNIPQGLQTSRFFQGGGV
jgi:hypothetical protein